MNEFKSSRGHRFVVGKNMANGVESPALVSWSDPVTGSWVPETDNEAGCMHLPIDLSPDVEIAERGDSIFFGSRVEFRFVGPPFIYGVWLDGKVPTEAA